MQIDEKMCIKSMLLNDVERLKSAISSRLDKLYEKHDVTVSIKKTDVLDLICSVHKEVDFLINFLRDGAL